MLNVTVEEELDGSSHHPPHVFKAVALGETLRILRNCSQQEAFERHKNKLIESLKARAFPRSARRIARHVEFAERDRMLAGERYTTKQREISKFFVTTKYNFVRPSLAKTLRTYWLAIESDPHLYSKFKVPPMVSYTRSKSLKTLVKNNRFACPDLIVPFPKPLSHFKFNKFQGQAHSRTCTSVRCKVCPRLLQHAVIRSRNNDLYPLDPSLTCTSTCVIYVLTCMHCKKQYVGQTGYSMRCRFAHHTYAFSRVHKSLYYHFKNIHKSGFDVSITLVERVSDKQERLASENGWVARLGTRLPQGLNTITSLPNYTPL